MKKVALIPSYEPTDALIDLLKELKKDKFKIVLVDDGSGKKYKKIFDKAKEYAEVISYTPNMGKGYALKEGLKLIKEKYSDYRIVTMDSDGQHTVKDANRLLEQVKPRTLLLGKRMIEKNTPLRSRFGNTLTRIINYLASGVKIYDTQTGLRAFDSSIIDYLLDVKGNRFEYEMKCLLQSKKHDVYIEEMVIKTIYLNNNSGSHFNAIKDSYRIYKEIFKFILPSIIYMVIGLLAFWGMYKLLPDAISAAVIASSTVILISSLVSYHGKINYLIFNILYMFVEVLAIVVFKNHPFWVNTIFTVLLFQIRNIYF